MTAYFGRACGDCGCAVIFFYGEQTFGITWALRATGRTAVGGRDGNALVPCCYVFLWHGTLSVLGIHPPVAVQHRQQYEYCRKLASNSTLLPLSEICA